MILVLSSRFTFYQHRHYQNTYFKLISILIIAYGGLYNNMEDYTTIKYSLQEMAALLIRFLRSLQIYPLKFHSILFHVPDKNLVSCSTFFILLKQPTSSYYLLYLPIKFIKCNNNYKLIQVGTYIFTLVLNIYEYTCMHLQ